MLGTVGNENAVNEADRSHCLLACKPVLLLARRPSNMPSPLRALRRAGILEWRPSHPQTEFRGSQVIPETVGIGAQLTPGSVCLLFGAEKGKKPCIIVHTVPFRIPERFWTSPSPAFSLSKRTGKLGPEQWDDFTSGRAGDRDGVMR